MGRLSGFRYAEIARRLRKLGFAFDRSAAGSHEIWRHQEDGRKLTLPRHTGDMPEGTLRAILRQAMISVEDFMSL